MKEIISSQFWNQETESTRSVDALVCCLPSEPPPLPSQISSRLSRSQQLLILQKLFLVPFTPSYVVDHDDRGGWVADRVLASVGQRHWWATVTGRLKVGRLWNRRSNILSNQGIDHPQAESPESTSNRLPWWQGLQNPQTYALSAKGRFILGPATNLSATAELESLSSVRNSQQAPGNIPWRGKISFIHKMKIHDLWVESSFNKICVDRLSRYFSVPKSLSVDLCSRVKFLGGFRYRIGVHHTSGGTQVCQLVEQSDLSAIPFGARAGTRAQAAMAAEKEICIWKGPVQKLKLAHNRMSARPRLTLSGMCGGILSAHVSSLSSSQSVSTTEGSPPVPNQNNPVFGADLFASVGATAHVGRFERMVLDHTIVTARFYCGAASDFTQCVVPNGQATAGSNGELSGPHESQAKGHHTIALSLQQQVIGPLRARMDKRYEVDPMRLRNAPRLLETTFGLDFPLARSGAAKIVAWYSPTRREGMAEIRILER